MELFEHVSLTPVCLTVSLFVSSFSFLGRRHRRRSSAVLTRFFCLHCLFVSYRPSSLNGTEPKPTTCLK